MHTNKEKIYLYFFNLLNVGLSIAVYMIAYFLRENFIQRGLSYSEQYIYLGVLIAFIWFILIPVFNLNTYQRGKTYAKIFIESLAVVGIGLSLLFLFIFALKFKEISRLVVFFFALLDLFVLLLLNSLIYSIIKAYRAKGYNINKTLVITDQDVSIIFDKICSNDEYGYELSVIVTDNEEVIDRFKNKVRILSADVDIHKFLEKETIDEVIYCKKIFNQKEINNLVYSCNEVGITFRIYSQWLNMITHHAQLNYLADTPFYTFSKTPSNQLALLIKKVFDFVFSLIIVILFAPFFLIIAILIKITSKGPVIFKQERVGLNGRKFIMYKFRTMIQNAEELKEKLNDKNEVDGPVFKIRNDPRLTKIGKFLRRSSFDEFPQFFNILKGDMSIVGPRPPVPAEVEKYKRWQLRRLSMKPGLTCIWQVSGRNNLNFDEWMRLDLQYIDSWSLTLDFVIFLKTFKAIFTGNGQ